MSDPRIDPTAWMDEQMRNAAPSLYEALEACQRLINEALPKFDWGKSALDGNAIQLLNEVPGQVSAALHLARGERP